jgi:hypothetical protein
MAPIVYFIGDPVLASAIPAFALTPSTCPYDLVYSATLLDGSPLPPAISITQSPSPTIRLSEADPNQLGSYVVRISVIDPLSTRANADLTVSVVVKCTKSISLLVDPIQDIRRLMEIDPPQTFSFAMPTYDVYPAFCLH